jgi:hypothetical protein
MGGALFRNSGGSRSVHLDQLACSPDHLGLVGQLVHDRLPVLQLNLQRPGAFHPSETARLDGLWL